MTRYLLLLLGWTICTSTWGTTKDTLLLDFHQCIDLALQNSIELKAAKTKLEAAEWRYKAYKACRMPQLSLQSHPLQYNNTFVSRYDYTNNREVYRNQKTLYSYGILSINQPVFITGGVLTLESGLNYIRNIGTDNYEQFSSTPIKISYSQELFGYNSWKWATRIEELNREKEEKQYRYIQESTIQKAAYIFFSLLGAQLQWKSARADFQTADTLFRAGKEKEKIRAISGTDIAILEMDLLDSQSRMEEAEYTLKSRREELRELIHVEKLIYIHENSAPPPKEVLFSEKDLQEAAQRNYTPFLEQKLLQTQAESNLDNLKKKRFFEAQLSVSIGFNQVSNHFSEVYRNLLRGDLATISLTLPLVDWGRRHAEIKQAEADMHNVQYSIQEAEKEISLKIKDLLRSIQSHYASLLRYREAFHLGKKAWKKMLIRYQNGIESATNLSLIRTKKQTAELKYFQALQSYWDNYYELKSLTLFKL